MTTIAATLGLLALLNLAAASSCAAMPAAPAACHGDREAPTKAPVTPTACHATQGCAEHRKIRNIP